MQMQARIVDGWLVVPYDGDDLARVHIAVGDDEPGQWMAAFLGWADGQRVAQIRPPDPLPPKVWLRVAASVTALGPITS